MLHQMQLFENVEISREIEINVKLFYLRNIIHKYYVKMII